MSRPLVAAAFLLCLSPLALADHHGRGNEPTKGFPGVYDVDRAMMTFTGDGYAILVAKWSNVAMSVQSYAIHDDKITLRDVSPPAFFDADAKRCARENDGKYKMLQEEGSFTLEKVDDPCDARAGLIARMVFKDYERPSSGG